MSTYAHLFEIVDADVGAQLAALNAGTHETAQQYDGPVTWPELVDTYRGYEFHDGLTTAYLAELCDVHPVVCGPLVRRWFATADAR